VEATKWDEIRAVKINDEWRIFVFVLSELLGTTPDELSEFLEDQFLAEKIIEVNSDESYLPEQGRQIYEKHLSESDRTCGK